MPRWTSKPRAGKGTFNLGITVNPSPEKLAQAFGVASKRFGDFRPAFRRIAPHLARGLAQNIRSRGASIGESWPSTEAGWAAEYQKRKQRGGYGAQSLLRSRMLYNQLTSPTAGVLSMGRKVLRFGSDLPYARAINFGSGANSNRRRMFMGWSDQMKNAAESELSAYVHELLAMLADDIRGGRRV